MTIALRLSSSLKCPSNVRHHIIYDHSLNIFAHNVTASAISFRLMHGSFMGPSSILVCDYDSFPKELHLHRLDATTIVTNAKTTSHSRHHFASCDCGNVGPKLKRIPGFFRNIADQLRQSFGLIVPCSPNRLDTTWLHFT